MTKIKAIKIPNKEYSTPKPTYFELKKLASNDNYRYKCRNCQVLEKYSGIKCKEHRI